MFQLLDHCANMCVGIFGSTMERTGNCNLFRIFLMLFLIIVCLLCLCGVSIRAAVIPLHQHISQQEIRYKRESTTTREQLLGNVFDFGDSAPGINLHLGQKRINVHSVSFTENEAEQIVALLRGQTLEERVHIWALMAECLMTEEENTDGGNTQPSYKIEELDMFEGDMVLSVHEMEALCEDTKNQMHERRKRSSKEVVSRNRKKAVRRPKRKLMADDRAIWPKEIPWKFMDEYYDFFKTRVALGMAEWEANTCIIFKEKTDDSDEPHLQITSENRCYATVGMQQKNGQPVSINAGCLKVGEVVHELGHALGMWHEQSRPDRDRYVEINVTNMDLGTLHNFRSYTWEQTMTEGVPYDYASIMHYPATAFSKNGDFTIQPMSPFYENTMGDRSRLSFYDAKAINYRYCSDECDDSRLSWDACANDGYRDPKNCSQCRCPTGWAPPYCDMPQSHSADKCGQKQVILARRLTGWIYSKYYFRYPSRNFPYLYPDNTECVWLLQAPQHMRIFFQLYYVFALNCPADTVCDEYVEVRYGDMARVGPRFCCTRRPLTRFHSHGRHMMIIFKSQHNTNNRGFLARYKAELCGGCDPTVARAREATCVATERFSCPQQTWNYCNVPQDKCYFMRENTCYREVEYCCLGYRQVGSKCIRIRRKRSATTGLRGAPF